MAYRRTKTKTGYRSGSARRTGGKRSPRRSSARRRTSGRSAQTLRIVVEQPQTAGSHSVLPTNVQSARKARF